MLAKLIVSAETRDAAIARAIAALSRYIILGIRTNIPFLLNILRDPRFRSGDVHTGYLDAEGAGLRTADDGDVPEAAVAASAYHDAHAASAPATRAGSVRHDPFDTLRGWGLR
jgi:acetyl-CoA carboxylase biotin carboxylase subunit